MSFFFRNLPSDHSYFQPSGHSDLPAVTLADIQKPPIGTSSEPSTPSAGAEKAAVTDDRRCLFCGSEGDEEEEEGAGRLLYFRCVCVCVCMCFSTVFFLFVFLKCCISLSNYFPYSGYDVIWVPTEYRSNGPRSTCACIACGTVA